MAKRMMAHWTVFYTDPMHCNLTNITISTQILQPIFNLQFFSFARAADGLCAVCNVNNLPAENFQYTQRLLVLHNQYSAGLTSASVSQSNYFDQGEGWTGTAIAQGQSINYTIDSFTTQ